MEAVCRLCLIDIAPPNNLFSGNYEEFYLIAVDLLHIPLPETGHWPKGVCSGCLKVLIDYHRFKEKVLEKQSCLPGKYPDPQPNSGRASEEPVVAGEEILIVEQQRKIEESPGIEEETSMHIAPDNESPTPSSRRRHRLVNATISSEGDLVGMATSTTPSEDCDSDQEDDAIDCTPDDDDSSLAAAGKDSSSKSKCPKCGKSFKKLSQHMKIHETSENLFICPQCDKLFPNKIRLSNHITCVHNRNREKFKCDTCGKGFAKMNTMREHMATHTGIPLYSCDYCGKEFNSQANKGKHEKTSHAKEWWAERSKKGKAK